MSFTVKFKAGRIWRTKTYPDEIGATLDHGTLLILSPEPNRQVIEMYGPGLAWKTRQL